jgi:hypothetical protein
MHTSVYGIAQIVFLFYEGPRVVLFALAHLFESSSRSRIQTFSKMSSQICSVAETAFPFLSRHDPGRFSSELSGYPDRWPTRFLYAVQQHATSIQG